MKISRAIPEYIKNIRPIVVVHNAPMIAHAKPIPISHNKIVTIIFLSLLINILNYLPERIKEATYSRVYTNNPLKSINIRDNYVTRGLA